ncbi:MAG: aldehyde dehydrogenase, partial [Chloroflexi bacterium]|nr:aldehyde dehydrogenase [Chloroflexota bacterium]
MTDILGPLIDGARPDASSDGVTSVRNPATGEEIARVGRSSADDADRAVEAAHRTYQSGEWRRAPVRERRDVLRRIADLVRRDLEELATLESQNAGKPITAARGEIGVVAGAFDYYAGAVDKFHGQTIPSQANGTLLTFREPIGVCAAITPWNFPLAILSWKVSPALAMGNSVVVKPAELTPLTALALGELALEAGLPSGVLNIVPGRGSEVGEALINNPLVRKISFTGSTEVGEHIMKSGAAGIKRVSLELGGKSASVVFADTSLESCVESSIFAAYDNAGQDCCSRSRIFVERPV